MFCYGGVFSKYIYRKDALLLTWLAELYLKSARSMVYNSFLIYF